MQGRKDAFSPCPSCPTGLSLPTDFKGHAPEKHPVTAQVRTPDTESAPYHMEKAGHFSQKTLAENRESAPPFACPRSNKACIGQARPIRTPATRAMCGFDLTLSPCKAGYLANFKLRVPLPSFQDRIYTPDGKWLTE